MQCWNSVVLTGQDEDALAKIFENQAKGSRLQHCLERFKGEMNLVLEQQGDLYR